MLEPVNYPNPNLTIRALFILSALALVMRPMHVRTTSTQDGVRKSTGLFPNPDNEFYHESHAIIFAVREYDHWADLPGAKEDVLGVRTVLERHGFRVKVVWDPTRLKFDDELRQFLADHGENPNNRLLVYFTGHGETLKTGYGQNKRMGFLVPADATKLDRNNPGSFKRKAININELITYAEQIEARHVLFVLDSCFSGALPFLRDAATATLDPISAKTAEPVRQFITAGTDDQQVPGDSYFREMFVKGLNSGGADRNEDGYVTGSELARFLGQRVSSHSQNPQTPQYGKINNRDLNAGDMLFTLPKMRRFPALVFSSRPEDPDVIEASDWNRTLRSRDIKEIDAFIEKYPKGRFLASAKIERDKLLSAEARRSERQRQSNPIGKDSSFTPTAFNTVSMNNGKLSPRSLVCDMRRETLGPYVEIELVRIPAGKFLMGAPRNVENLRDYINKPIPIHWVTLDEFLLSRHETTQAQWRFIAALPPVKIPLPLNPSEHTGERLPVTNVTWSEVKEFIARLNRELGLGERHGYRLPSEAEWEYATRAGTLTQFAFGDSIRPDIVNYDWRRSFGPTEVDKVKIATVGSLGFANAWGLFDMHGNVMEWCEDDWHPDYVGAPADGRPWITEAGNRGRDRVIRGGGYEDIAKSCRSAARYAENANTNKDYIGFRLARPHLK